MAYTKATWQKRVTSRVDICGQIVHLTRGNTIEGFQLSPLQVLIRILRERRLQGSSPSSGFIVGNRPAVCFQDAPLYSICQNIDFDRALVKDAGGGRTRYTPTGLMFPKPYVYSLGGRPVVYEQTEVAKQLLPQEEWWRIVRFDMANPESFIDWTHEREWRLPDDLQFDIAQATVVVANATSFKHFFEHGAAGGEDITQLVRAVVPLGTLYA